VLVQNLRGLKTELQQNDDRPRIARERILKAAERLFADRGYEETSGRAIVA
jgi:AcrR family transcriptional regulator